MILGSRKFRRFIVEDSLIRISGDVDATNASLDLIRVSTC